MDERTLILLIIVVLVILVIVWLLRRGSKCTNNTSKSVNNFSHHRKHIQTGKSETLPTFLRKNNRIIVTGPKPSVHIDLPEKFDSRQQWPGWITGVMDQGTCGSCWAFSSCGVFGDRIRIASNGKDLPKKDFISQYHLAACMKCGSNHTNKVCSKVCSGHYMDEVIDYLRTNGSYSHDVINKHANFGETYVCFKPSDKQDAKLYKATGAYRVNPYPVEEISSSKTNRESNEYAIMHDIYTYGPVTATIRVFDPLGAKDLHKNFYLYTTGVYGINWGPDPKASDGYHAISIIGWGVEKGHKYWLIRNSWGIDWGQGGYGKILRGENRIIIESDIWAMHYH